MAQGDIQDVRVFDGTKWESLIGPQGPPGPPEVSSDPENNITIGGDGLPYYKTDYRLPAPSPDVPWDNDLTSSPNGEQVYVNAFPVVWGYQSPPQQGGLLGVESCWDLGYLDNTDFSDRPGINLRLFQWSSISVGVDADDPERECFRVTGNGNGLTSDASPLSTISCDRTDLIVLTPQSVEVKKALVLAAESTTVGAYLYIEAERGVSGNPGSRWPVFSEPSRDLGGGMVTTPNIQIRDASNRSFIRLVSGPHVGPNGDARDTQETLFSCDVTLLNCVTENGVARRANFSVTGNVTFGPLGSFNSQGAATFKTGSINRDGIGPKIGVPVLANLTVDDIHANCTLTIGANVTLTVPGDATIPVGFECDVLIPGSNTCRLSAATGVSLRYRTEGKIGGLQAQVSVESPWGKARLTKVASNVWYAEGTLSNASI